MPLPGPAPKPPGQARRRNRPIHDWVEVADVAFDGAPALPRRMPNGLPWPSWTKRWWKAISTMPHCKLWAASDWEFAFDTAVLKALFHISGGPSVATEIRNRERVLGTTEDYRRALRIRYVPVGPTSEPAGDVTNLDDYRDL